MVLENKGLEDIDSLREKLQAVSHEIDTIKNSFSKNKWENRLDPKI